MTRKEVARVYGLSYQTVSRAVSRGSIACTAKDGITEEDAEARWGYRRELKKESRKGPSEYLTSEADIDACGGMSVIEATTRKRVAEARLAELKYAQNRGSAVSVEAVKDVFNTCIGGLTQSLLNPPRELLARIADIEEDERNARMILIRNEIIEFVKRECSRVQDELPDKYKR